MHISKLSIRNFRNFKNANFYFQKGVNTLIGENGSGKTNAFFAIRLLIDDSLSRRSIQLRESDFNRALGDWKGHWVIISLDFEELDTSEGCQIIRHNVGHMTEGVIISVGIMLLYFQNHLPNTDPTYYLLVMF